jgi:hypothetical protein
MPDRWMIIKWAKRHLSTVRTPVINDHDKSAIPTAVAPNKPNPTAGNCIWAYSALKMNRTEQYIMISVMSETESSWTTMHHPLAAKINVE